MRVYSFRITEEHEWVQAWDVWDQVYAAAGVPQGPSRSPFTVELMQTDDSGAPRIQADAPYFLDMLAFREPAWERVREYLQDWGEILPVHCPQAPLVAFNALHVINDALDEDRSLLSRFDDGRVMRIKDWVFHPDRVPPEGIFRIPQNRSRVLCTEVTADHLRALNLSGLRLDLLWSTEPRPPLAHPPDQQADGPPQGRR